MNRRWVLNASRIIILSKISAVRLLTELCDDLIIPEGVAKEIRMGPHTDPARKWMEKEGKRFIVPSIPISPLLAAWDLGLGESEVIAYAIEHPEYEVIIDDLAARKCARSFGIRCK